MNDIKELALQAVEVAKTSGKIKKGTNEVTKSMEKGNAKLVVYAKDTQPAEIIMHLPVLAKEKNIPCIEVESREELGAAAGIGRPTSSVAIVVEGDSKKIISEIIKASAEK
jgi:large subunit ribosomal protein L7Ae